ncbi:MAG: phosphoserine phosphatase SerB [Gammaproteobacteria bacterium]|nr:phosphoserine phosphatase SerB [Gammaproteobacteria bacterium]
MHKYILDTVLADDYRDQISRALGEFDSQTYSSYSVIKSATKLDHNQLRELSQKLECDFNLIPGDFDASTVKLVISDMDSTFINIECIDEIADFAGKKAEVSAVTEAAMRGELDFSQSLIKRVALLAGLSIDVLDTVYTERLQLNPGGEAMLLGLKNSQIRFALVSGGFTHFTSKLKQRYALDYARANTLEKQDGKLTGKVEGQIVDGKVKAGYLESLCAELEISPAQTVAMGDGANDLLMMDIAGLGVAYRAKPTVQQKAGCSINYGGLDGVLSLLEIEKPAS